MRTQKGEIAGDKVTYEFRCDGCDSEGQLTVPLAYGIRIDCPEGCGAGYIQFKGLDGGPALTCVVAPIPYRPDAYYLEDEEDEEELGGDFDDDLELEVPDPADSRQQELGF